METELLFLKDAYLRSFDACVIEVEGTRVALDRTAFYPTGGGQPHDIGVLGSARVSTVSKEGGIVWHDLQGVVPSKGDQVHGELDWDRRFALMRTHTAVHVLCGVIWNRWGTAVTGGNMEPLEARMDFQFDPLPDGFGTEVERLINVEIAASRPISVSFLPQGVALEDEGLIRTKENRVPESATEIRVVDIVGLDKQADGGTHVKNTREVGRIEVIKTESKGKGNKRIRLRVRDV